MALSWSLCSSCATPSWSKALRWRGERNGVDETLVSMALQGLGQLNRVSGLLYPRAALVDGIGAQLSV
jgi:hypothetical protein